LLLDGVEMTHTGSPRIVRGYIMHSVDGCGYLCDIILKQAQHDWSNERGVTTHFGCYWMILK